MVISMNLTVLSRLIILVLLVSVTACNQTGENHEHSDTYTCPMHPTVISDKPGTCPVCAMDLVRKARPGEEVQITKDLRALLNSPNEVIVSDARTIKGTYKKMPLTFSASGIVTYDTRFTASIPVRIGGRLEKVSLRYPMQPVKKGEKIAEIYSPELVTAQRELVYLLKNETVDKTLIEGAKERLRLMGMNETQLNRLVDTKEVTYTFSIFSTQSGYAVPAEDQVPSAAMAPSPPSTTGGMGDGMGGSSSPAPGQAVPAQTSATNTFYSEGNYVQAGQTLFKVVNPEGILVELNVPAETHDLIKKGSKVLLDLGTRDSVEATVDLVEPVFAEGQNFQRIRVYVSKQENLHIGHLVTAVLLADSEESLWVPRESVIDTGTDKVVFVHEQNVFRPRKISIGVSSGNLIQVRDGLASSDRIAENARFLVDSESFINVKPD